MATKDLFTATVLTIIFVILINEVFAKELDDLEENNDKKGGSYNKNELEKTIKSLTKLKIGFKIILSTGATKSHVPYRDMAVICQKPFLQDVKKISRNSEYWKKKYGNFLSRIFIQFKSILKLSFLAFK